MRASDVKVYEIQAKDLGDRTVHTFDAFVRRHGIFVFSGHFCAPLDTPESDLWLVVAEALGAEIEEEDDLS